MTSFAGHGNDRQGLDLKCGKNKLLASLNRKTTKDFPSGRRADSLKKTYDNYGVKLVQNYFLVIGIEYTDTVLSFISSYLIEYLKKIVFVVLEVRRTI